MRVPTFRSAAVGFALAAAVLLAPSLASAADSPVPNVIGQQLSAAQSALTASGFSPFPGSTCNGPTAIVNAQNPGAGTQAASGATVNLTCTPATTTTTAATTTTQATTTTHATTTTEKASTTTAASTSSSSSTTWAWVLGIIAVLALIAAGIAALVGARRRKEDADSWLPQARAGLENASLARSLLIAQPTGGDEQVAQVRAQAEDAAQALDRVAASAPDEQRRQASSSVAEGLRGVLFCLEAERLLRNGATPPTAAQLSEADVARRRRSGELDASLSQLDFMTRPPER